MSDRIEAQVERFAPGFRSRILARSCMNTEVLQQHNANLQGGDIGGGAAVLRQFLFRPTASLYRTSAKGVYLCSSSTPPGGGAVPLKYEIPRATLAFFGNPRESM